MFPLSRLTRPGFSSFGSDFAFGAVFGIAELLDDVAALAVFGVAELLDDADAIAASYVSTRKGVLNASSAAKTWRKSPSDAAHEDPARLKVEIGSSDPM